MDEVVMDEVKVLVKLNSHLEEYENFSSTFIRGKMELNYFDFQATLINLEYKLWDKETTYDSTLETLAAKEGGSNYQK